MKTCKVLQPLFAGGESVVSTGFAVWFSPGKTTGTTAVAKRKKAVPSRVGQFVARDQHIHNHWPESAPPDDPKMSRQCPQCKQLTWRYTPVCMHCALDVAAYERRQRWMALLRWPLQRVMRRP